MGDRQVLLRDGFDDEEAHAINHRLRQKCLTAPALDTVGAAWETVDDVAVEIAPTKWRSWSNHALTELGKAVAGDLAPSEWWVPGST